MRQNDSLYFIFNAKDGGESDLKEAVDAVRDDLWEYALFRINREMSKRGYQQKTASGEAVTVIRNRAERS